MKEVRRENTSIMVERQKDGGVGMGSDGEGGSTNVGEY